MRPIENGKNGPIVIELAAKDVVYKGLEEKGYSPAHEVGGPSGVVFRDKSTGRLFESLSNRDCCFMQDL